MPFNMLEAILQPRLLPDLLPPKNGSSQKLALLLPKSQVVSPSPSFCIKAL
jgi:hypothetical protein